MTALATIAVIVYLVGVLFLVLVVMPEDRDPTREHWLSWTVFISLWPLWLIALTAIVVEARMTGRR